MKEKTKVVTIIGAILLVALIIFVSTNSSAKKSKQYIEEIKTIASQAYPSFFFITKDDCVYSNEIKPSIKSLEVAYNFPTNYLNITKVTDEQLLEIQKIFEIEAEEIVTPYLVVVQKGKVLGSMKGLQTEKTVFEFLQKNKIIDGNEIYISEEERYTNINILKYEDYSNIYNNSETQLLIIGQKKCGNCNLVKNLLNRKAEQMGIKINYLEITNYTQEQRKAVFDSIDYFQTAEGWSTPLTFVLKDGKTISNKEGYTTDSEYMKYLKENNINIGE